MNWFKLYIQIILFFIRFNRWCRLIKLWYWDICKFLCGR